MGRHREGSWPASARVFRGLFVLKEAGRALGVVLHFWHRFVLRRSAEVFRACGDLSGSKGPSCCSGQLHPVVWLLKFSNSVWLSSVWQLVVLRAAVNAQEQEGGQRLPSSWWEGWLVLVEAAKDISVAHQRSRLPVRQTSSLPVPALRWSWGRAHTCVFVLMLP